MSGIHRASPESFRELPLRVHAVLDGVPLRDVTVVDLPGGGPGRTLSDVRALMPEGSRHAGGAVTRLLFAIREGVGRAFGWDARPEDASPSPFRARVPEDVLRRSKVAPGERSGPFSTLYELEDEAVVEARNATVHAFLASILQPVEGGYRLYWAVYVQPIRRFTALYMAAIEPFRRFVVYPSILRSIRERWQSAYSGG